MKRAKCAICPSDSVMSYEVDPSKPKPLCGECMRRWDPPELNALLGIVDPNVSPKIGNSMPIQAS